MGGSPVLVLVDLGRGSPVPPPAPKHGLCVSGPAYRVPQSIANFKFSFSIQTLRELCKVNDSSVCLCGIAMHRRALKICFGSLQVLKYPYQLWYARVAVPAKLNRATWNLYCRPCRRFRANRCITCVSRGSAALHWLPNRIRDTSTSM